MQRFVGPLTTRFASIEERDLARLHARLILADPNPFITSSRPPPPSVRPRPGLDRSVLPPGAAHQARGAGPHNIDCPQIRWPNHLGLWYNALPENQMANYLGLCSLQEPVGDIPNDVYHLSAGLAEFIQRLLRLLW